MSPIRAERERVEANGPSSKPADHLAHAQRAYLYALHRATGLLAILLPVTTIVIGLAIFFTRPLTASRATIVGGFSVTVLCWFVLARALRLLLAGDPAYRMSGRLFIVRKSITPAALLVAFAGGVLTAGRISSQASSFAPRGLLLAMIGAGMVWLVGLTAWRTRSLLKRCDGSKDAPWSDIGALALLIATLATLLTTSLPTGTLTNILLVAASVVALLASLSMALALLRLRSRVGAVMRDMEQAEPGPAFEPVAPGS